MIKAISQTEIDALIIFATIFATYPQYPNPKLIFSLYLLSLYYKYIDTDFRSPQKCISLMNRLTCYCFVVFQMCILYRVCIVYGTRLHIYLHCELLSKYVNPKMLCKIYGTEYSIEAN